MLWVMSGAVSVPGSLIRVATRAGISTPLGRRPTLHTSHLHTHTDRASALAGVWLANKRPLIILLESRLTTGIATIMIANQLINTTTS